MRRQGIAGRMTSVLVCAKTTSVIVGSVSVVQAACPDWHHIVPQSKANIAKFGAEAIHNTKNLEAVEANGR